MTKRTNATERVSLLAKISLLFFGMKRLTPFLMIALVLFGALSYFVLLRREGFPAVNVPISIANGVYFVDDAASVDKEVAQPLAQLALAVDGVESISTFSDSNFFTLVANLESDASSAVVNEAIQKQLEQETPLPPEASVTFPEINAAKFLGQFDMTVSLVDQSGSAGAADLEAQAKELAERLQALDLVETAGAQALFEAGINPATGEQVVQQTSYGRFGVVQDGSFEFLPSVIIGIIGSGGEELDVFDLSAQVSDEIEQINNELGDDSRLAISADFTDSISTQISSLQMNVVTGLIAVSLVSLLMISWRVSIMSVIFMLSVIFITAGVLLLAGYTLNTITLFALVLALGLFVDDATIISEAIDANKDKSLSPKQIIGRAISSVGAASAAGTTTTILVFVPLLFVGGIIGEFIYLLPLTVIISLVTSLTLSLTLIPYLSRYTILTRNNLEKQPWNNPVPYMLERSIKRLKTNRKIGVPWALTMVAISFAFVGASVYFASQLTFNIFPPSKDSDQIVLTYELPPMTSIERAEEVADEINAAVESVVDDNLVRSTYGFNNFPSARGADMLIELTPFSDRDIKSPEIISQLERAFAGYGEAEVRLGQSDAGPPAEQFPFKVQVFGEETEQLTQLAEEINRSLTGSSITRASGTEANISETTVSFTDTIARKDGREYVEVGAAFDADDTTALVQATREKVEAEFDNEVLASYGLTAADLAFDFGQESDNEESFSALGPAALASLAAMFVLLAIQFRSVVKPILIFLALPFSFLGVMYGLYVTNNALSFFAMVGVIGLLGIAVNNTIMLTDYANQRRRRGMDSIDSIAEASRARFRPLFTTTATTVAALAPLAMSDPFWEPLAVAIIFGLISSTFLVIMSFPYYYIAAEFVSLKIRRIFRRSAA